MSRATSQMTKSALKSATAPVTDLLTAGLQFVDPMVIRQHPLNFRDPMLREQDHKALAESFRASYKSAIADKRDPEIKFEPLWVSQRADGARIVLRGNTRTGTYQKDLTSEERKAMFPRGFPAIVFVGLSEAEELAMIPDQDEPGQRRYNAYEKWHGYAMLRDKGLTPKEAGHKMGLSVSPNERAPMAQRYDELRYLPKRIHDLFRESARPIVKDEKGNVTWTPPKFPTWTQVTELYQIQKRYREADKLRTQDDEAPEFVEKLTAATANNASATLKPLTSKQTKDLADMIGKSTPYHACAWLALHVVLGNVKQSVLTDCLKTPADFDSEKLNKLIEQSKAAK